MGGTAEVAYAERFTAESAEIGAAGGPPAGL
jgi:hypothetical protein